MKGIRGRVGAVESSEALPLPSGQRSGPPYFTVLGSCGSLFLW